MIILKTKFLAHKKVIIFLFSIFRVSKDIETGFLTINVKHQSPIVAQAWAETVVNQINYFFRSKAKKEASRLNRLS